MRVLMKDIVYSKKGALDGIIYILIVYLKSKA
jgi:hypothetical protein